MLHQGSTKQVVEYFIAENDYEMFELSVQNRNDLNMYGAYTPVFERGGKWYETLAAHVQNLNQREESFFEGLLNNGNFDRYYQIMEHRGGPFKGVGGYMVWPEKVKEPQKYIEFAWIYMAKNQPRKGRILYVEDIVRYFGDEK